MSKVLLAKKYKFLKNEPKSRKSLYGHFVSQFKSFIVFWNKNITLSQKLWALDDYSV